MGRPPSRGFTLIELLVVVAVGSVVLSMTYVAAGDFLDRWRVDSATRDIVSALQAARAQAILEQSQVTMPFDENRRIYVLTSEKGAGGAFKKGGIYYAQLPGSIEYCAPDGSDPIGFSPPSSPKSTVAVFDSSGLLLSNNVPSNVFVCDAANDTYRRISVSPLGTITVNQWTGSAWD